MIIVLGKRRCCQDTQLSKMTATGVIIHLSISSDREMTKVRINEWWKKMRHAFLNSYINEVSYTEVSTISVIKNIS